MTPKVNLAIFASGNGSNAEVIIRYFAEHPDIQVSALFCNRADAYVIERAKRFDLPVVVFNKNDFYETEKVILELKRFRIDWIVLAGFLWLVPRNLLTQFSNKIVNIHPALLPKFGGKGMYGQRVHDAVLAAGESQSGITIHLLNENFDEGPIIFQRSLPVKTDDTPETLSQRIHELEHEHYAPEVERLILRAAKSEAEKI